MANPHRKAARERFWREHLAAWRRSGLSVRAYCHRHDLAQPTFYLWRRNLEQRPATSTPNQPATQPTPANPPFIPVRLVGPTPNLPVLELVLRGGRIIRVPNGFAPEALRQLITLAEQLPC
jgi:transposase